jgi:creatinine amidohydrolase/Fe(II)-dependent formamide hydrolase-like protein
VQPSRREQIRAARSPIASWGEFTGAADYRGNCPDDGIGSNPGLATPNAGRRLCDTAVAAVTEDYLDSVAARGRGGGGSLHDHGVPRGGTHLAPGDRRIG